MRSIASFFKSSSTQVAVTVQMTPADAAVIRAFAAGDKSLRDRAITIHRAWMPKIGARGTPEQDFMAEIDNPCPDLILRSQYRAKLLGKPAVA